MSYSKVLEEWGNLAENENEPSNSDFVGESTSSNQEHWQQNEDLCNRHRVALNFYFGNCNLSSVEELGPAIAIPTPNHLIGRHLVTKPIDSMKAIELAVSRERTECTTTVFEDPGIFWAYPLLEIIISQSKVKLFEVLPMKNSSSLCAYYRGLSWAIFEATYHFQWQRFKKLPNDV